MKATVALVLAVATLAAGCGARSSSDRLSAPSSGPVASATSTPTAGLVGRWERVTTCQELVRELDQAGLGPLRAYAWLVLQPHLPFASLVVCAAGTSLVAASPS
jgi:hypothetical protein